jgi:integrase
VSVRKRRWVTKPKEGEEKGEPRECYVVAYRTGTGRHIKSFKRKKDADDFHAQVRVDIGKGVHVPHSKSVTVEKAGDQWIQSCATLERTTREQYMSHLKFHILPILGAVKLSALTVAMVRAWQDRLTAEGRSPAMARKVTTSLSSLLADAMERGTVAQNVVRSMATNRRGKHKAAARANGKLKSGTDFPTPDEIQSLLGVAMGKWRPFLLVAIRCGLRSSELRGLRWSDVDLTKSELHVRQRADQYGRIGWPKSEDSHRTVPMLPATVQALREWKMACPKGELDLAFPNGLGHVESHGNIITRGLIPAWQAAGIVDRYSGLHCLRHYFVSWCLARPPVGLGLTLKEASERAGHANISITADTYGHLLPRSDAAALAAAEGRFG